MGKGRAGYGEMVPKSEAASYLGVSIRTLDRYREAGWLCHERVLGDDRFLGRVWFRKAHLNAFLRRRDRT